MTLDPRHVQWSKTMFAVLAEGSVWGVPRSGLLFRRRGDELVLEQRMPYDPAMPGTAADLREWQDVDYLDIKQHFEAAGVTVRKSAELADS